MRNLFLVNLILLFVSCQSSSGDYTINISANVEDDHQIFLVNFDDENKPNVIDTLFVKEGLASYSGVSKLPDYQSLWVDGVRGSVPIFVEQGEITVEIYKDSIQTSKVSGTKTNVAFKRYKDEINPLFKSFYEIQNDMRNAMISRDSLGYKDLEEQLKEMETKFINFQKDYTKSNPDSYVSAMVLIQLVMNKAIENEEAFEIYNNFSKTIKKTKSAIKINQLVAPKETEEVTEDGEVNVGDIAPDFTAPDPNAVAISLNTTLGKLTILDFWASWCGPCRVDSPNLVKVHNAYKDNGLAIIGISLDKNKGSWEKAIENDKLDWTQVSHLMRWDDPTAAAYGVNSIPQLFLLDENGIVIAKERHAEDFIPILEQILL
jgi:thiol-disulfide isomerase/thioredoxin